MFAVLAVFVYHGANGLLRGGFLGVDVFFVLSGTVITLLLLREFEHSRRIRFGRFYINRLARLWPALLAVCVVVVLAIRVFPGPPWDVVRSAIASAFYLSDVAVAFHSAAFSSGAAFGHMWSLAVEEQFYLVWPLLFVLLMRALGHRGTIIATAVLMLLPSVLRLALWDDGRGLDRIYNMPDTRADELLAGCLLALTLSLLRGGAPSVRRVLSWAIWPASLLLVALMVVLRGPEVGGAHAPELQWTVGQLGIAVLAALLIGGLAVTPRHPVSRVLGSRWLSWPGRHLSYGFYLWHIPVLVVLGQTGLRVTLQLAIAFVVTATLAFLSSRFLEEPVRRAVRKRMKLRVADPAWRGSRETG